MSATVSSVRSIPVLRPAVDAVGVVLRHKMALAVVSLLIVLINCPTLLLLLMTISLMPKTWLLCLNNCPPGAPLSQRHPIASVVRKTTISNGRKTRWRPTVTGSSMASMQPSWCPSSGDKWSVSRDTSDYYTNDVNKPALFKYGDNLVTLPRTHVRHVALDIISFPIRLV